MRWFWTITFFLTISVAFAADPHTGDAPPVAVGPAMNAANGGVASAAQPGRQTACAHNSTSRISVGGIDLDTLRCQVERLELSLAQTTVKLALDDAKIEMLQNDLEDAKAQAAPGATPSATPTPNK